MYNATNVATWLRAPQRFATRLRVLRRASIQLNDLFITFRVSTRRYSARLGTTQRRAPQRNATICLLQRNSALRRSSPLGSAFGSAPQRNDLFVNLLSRLGSTRRNSACLTAPQFNATICLLLRDATWLIASLRSSAQLNDLFVTSPRNVPPCSTALRRSTQLNDLFVNLSSLRAAALLDFPQRYALLLNDLFVNLLSRLDTALGNEPRRNSACRDAQQLNATN